MTWILLLALLALEVGATLLHAGWLGFVTAPAMIGLVAFRFMHVAQQSALTRIFAVAGLFWLTVLLGLGSIDYLVRQDVQAGSTTIGQ